VRLERQATRVGEVEGVSEHPARVVARIRRALIVEERNAFSGDVDRDCVYRGLVGILNAVDVDPRAALD
jgi:hypothetical protein